MNKKISYYIKFINTFIGFIFIGFIYRKLEQNTYVQQIN
jgi:hypothetical protein